jgi:hypothetical protein
MSCAGKGIHSSYEIFCFTSFDVSCLAMLIQQCYTCSWLSGPPVGVAAAAEVRSRRKSKKRRIRKRNRRNQKPKDDLGRNYTKYNDVLVSLKRLCGTFVSRK